LARRSPSPARLFLVRLAAGTQPWPQAFSLSGGRRWRSRGRMTIFRPGYTCWRAEPADRAAFLIDTEAYFTALFEAFQKARRSILLVGGGSDPRTRLFPAGYDGPDDPDEVGRILVELARGRPDLEVRLL